MTPTAGAPAPDHHHDLLFEPDPPRPPRDRTMLSVITRLGVGGSDRRLYDVLAALDDVEHHIVVGADSSHDAVDALRADHRVSMYPELVRSISPRLDMAASTRLARELRRDGYGALITHQSKAGLVGRVAARLAGTSPVYHSASMASFGPGYGRVQSLVFQVAERVTAPLVDRYFVVGQDLIDRMAANGIDPSKLELVRSSIDTRPFLAARDAGPVAARHALDVAVDATVVCFVGRLDERKGAPRLVDLFGEISARLATRAEPTLLLVAGRGPCADDMRSRARSLGLDASIRFLGHTDRVPQVLAASDLVILPSSAEGVPQVLVQAAVTGTPFASFDVDGARELLALGATGTIAPIGADPVLVAHAVALLGARRVASPPWDADTLAQWDPAHVRAQYRAALDQ
jgi:glycosyltransferase involved in cell wall biosynthesis